jgi:hypothetical protein
MPELRTGLDKSQARAARPSRLTSERESLLVFGHGIEVEALVELINAGLAKVRVDRLRQPAMEVRHIEITPLAQG